MQRFIVAGVLGLMISPWIFGQSTSAHSRDRRLDDALTDIALLKRLVKEQDRKIADLEKALHALEGVVPATATESKSKVTLKPLGAPWLSPLTWAQIAEGMSRAQVEQILGKPTTVDSVIDYQTLNYTGDRPGGGVLTGSVKLTDDRVSAVNPPSF